MTVVVAAAQLHLQIGEVAANRAAALAAIADAAGRGARLVVLPELADTGYVFSGADEALALADGVATLGGWVDAAARHRVVVVGGFCERAGDAVHNSAAVVDGSGVLAVYRKVHLWGRESEVFIAGSGVPPVVATAAGRVGVMICYDLEFPEWTRVAALAGTEILAVPVNWPVAPVPVGERPAEVVAAQAAAATNRMAVVVADRGGAERGVDWVGGTMVVDQDGYPLAGPVLAGTATLLTAAPDPAASRDKRVGDRNDRMADRRPELYGVATGGWDAHPERSVKTS